MQLILVILDVPHYLSYLNLDHFLLKTMFSICRNWNSFVLNISQLLVQYLILLVLNTFLWTFSVETDLQFLFSGFYGLLSSFSLRFLIFPFEANCLVTASPLSSSQAALLLFNSHVTCAVVPATVSLLLPPKVVLSLSFPSLC